MNRNKTTNENKIIKKKKNKNISIYTNSNNNNIKNTYEKQNYISKKEYIRIRINKIQNKNNK